MREPCLQVGTRSLYFGALGEQLPLGITSPFVALLPAYTAAECAAAADIIPALIKARCVEICCVGERAELLHDQLDDIVEDMEAVHVVTTFHAGEDDASEYFMFAAGAAAACLLAFVSPHPSLVARLRALAEGMLA